MRRGWMAGLGMCLLLPACVPDPGAGYPGGGGYYGGGYGYSGYAAPGYASPGYVSPGYEGPVYGGPAYVAPTYVSPGIGVGIVEFDRGRRPPPDRFVQQRYEQERYNRDRFERERRSEGRPPPQQQVRPSPPEARPAPSQGPGPVGDRAALFRQQRGGPEVTFGPSGQRLQ